METTIEKVIHLQRVEVFADISTEQLAHVAAITQDIRVKAGNIIFKEGESPDSLYILVDGGVKISQEDGEEQTIEEDEVFGIWGFFDQEPYLHTAKTTEESYLLKINHVDFYELLEDRAHLGSGIICFLMKKIREFLDEENQNKDK